MNATDEARVREIEDCVKLDGYAAAGTYVPELIAMLRKLMAKALHGSRYGEGAGGPVSAVEDPNNPSFDPATHESATDEKIRYLLGESMIKQLSNWEESFLMGVYGESPLSRKVHIKVWQIYKRHTEPARE